MPEAKKKAEEKKKQREKIAQYVGETAEVAQLAACDAQIASESANEAVEQLKIEKEAEEEKRRNENFYGIFTVNIMSASHLRKIELSSRGTHVGGWVDTMSGDNDPWVEVEFEGLETQKIAKAEEAVFPIWEDGAGKMDFWVVRRYADMPETFVIKVLDDESVGKECSIGQVKMMLPREHMDDATEITLDLESESDNATVTFMCQMRVFEEEDRAQFEKIYNRRQQTSEYDAYAIQAMMEESKLLDPKTDVEETDG